VRFISAALMNGEFNRLVAADMSFALGSIVFVFFYIWFHTGTMMIAFVTMMIIVFSLPVSALFIGGVCQVIPLP